MSNRASEPDASVPPHERVQRHAVGVTRLCLRNGSVQLPRSLDGALPGGEIIVLDVERDEPIALWSEPPRTLRGLHDLFDAHDVMVNDELVVELEGTDVRLSVAKRPRRDVAHVQPSTWTSLQETPPPRPGPDVTTTTPRDEPETAAPTGRVTAPRNAMPSANQALPEPPLQPRWTDRGAQDDDAPRAPRVPTRPATAHHPRPRTMDMADPDDEPRERGTTRGGWLATLRTLFRGGSLGQENPSRQPDTRHHAPSEPARQPTSRPIERETTEGAWRVAHDGLLDADERLPPPRRAASNQPQREPQAEPPTESTVPAEGPAGHPRATPPPVAPRKVGPGSVAPPDASPIPGRKATADAAPVPHQPSADGEGAKEPTFLQHEPTLDAEPLLDEHDLLAGDLRTRLLRYLRHPEMPVVAKRERIAKRFDLDVATADELLADIAADPPEGLRLMPVRDGAWRIERRLS